jgi:RND family efflux transporter MFP subunit
MCRATQCSAVTVAAVLLGLVPDGSVAQTDPTPRVVAESFDCLMNASDHVELGAPVAGLLRSVAVTRGDRVRAGQPIATLASEVEEAQLDVARISAQSDVELRSAEARRDFAQKKLARLQGLGQSRLVPQKELEEAESEAAVAEQAVREAEMNHTAAQAELRRAEALLAQRRILSPFDGVVVERHLSPGAYVNDQAKIATLASIDTLHVEVYVPVAFYGQIHRGDEATVLPDQPLGGQYPAKVVIVDPVIDAASGTFGVRLLLPNSDWRLPAGLRCRAAFGPAAAGSAEAAP